MTTLQEFESVMYGKKQKAPRWKDCTSRTLQRMKFAAGAIYVSTAFDQSSKNTTLDMVEDFRESFQEMLTENTWMDEKTKKSAIQKSLEMLSQIAYPDFILNGKELDNHYDNFSVSENDSYSDMVEKISRWDIEFDFKRLIKPVERDEYDFNAAVVNAYYAPDVNAIQFPAAILQAPYFDHSFPKALNYGGIGTVIGHETTHGFDDEGSDSSFFYIANSQRRQPINRGRRIWGR
ncbi:peptidase family M13 [Ostertagia ostertagi]